MQEKILDMLVALGRWQEGMAYKGCAETHPMVFKRQKEVAAEIAKLWEDTEVEIIEQYQDCLDKHHVQLAEMREAFTELLQMCHTLDDDPDYIDWNNLVRKAEEALSAAPKEKD